MTALIELLKQNYLFELKLRHSFYDGEDIEKTFIKVHVYIHFTFHFAIKIWVMNVHQCVN